MVGGELQKWRKKQKKARKYKHYYIASTFRGNQATRYGRSMEAVSIHQYVSHHQKQDPNFRVDKCELFISETNYWLAASPDGIVHDLSNTAD